MPYDPDGVTFVDVGAFDGRSSRAYAKRHDVRHIHLWEPNPLINVRAPDVPCAIHTAAAYTVNGHREFYLSSAPRGYGNGQGSTLLWEKTTGDLDRVAPIRVVTIDFAEWLYERSDQAMVVKLNIEGAEYELLGHLAVTGALAIPEEWIISWHGAKVHKTDADAAALREALVDAGYRLAIPHDDFPTFERWRRCG